MGDFEDFAVVYPPDDRDIAEALRDQLRHLGLTGDLYPSESVRDEIALEKIVIAKFFIASQNKLDDAYKRAQEKLKESPDRLTIPVWLSPGKDSLVNNEPTKDHYFDFASVQGLVGRKPGKTDFDFVSSDDFRRGFERRKLKENILEKKSEKTEQQEMPIGLGVRGIAGGMAIAPEKATGSVDVLGHKKFAEKIASAMILSSDFETPATIGIFAPWGSGKTRFINCIKEKCEDEGGRLDIAEKRVNCCCVDTCCKWWTRLIVWAFIALVATVAIMASIIALSHPSLQPCQSLNVTSRHHDDEANMADNVTYATILTTQAPCDDSRKVKEHYWYYPALGAIAMVIVLFLASLCQRKVLADCRETYADCCCGYPVEDSTQTSGKVRSENADGQGIEMQNLKTPTSSDNQAGQENQGLLRNEEQSTAGRDNRRKRCANCCLDWKALCYMMWFRPPKGTDDGVDVDEVTDGESEEATVAKQLRVITVDFNAWEFSGCDYLWAGIVTTLGNTVEDYFGKWKVRLCRVLLSRTSGDGEATPRSYAFACCRLRFGVFLLLLFALSVIAIATTVVVIVATDVGQGFDDSIKKSPIWIAASSLLIALTAVATAFGIVTKKVVQSTESLVTDISREMRGQDFEQELGFMHKIKEEVHHITDIVNFMSRLYGCHFRVLLAIDDLDRCQSDRIMGVLGAVSLLLEPKKGTISPYVSILAIDPRVILGAIERHFDPDNRRDYSQANVNGYEYLKKIIHMPLCLPPLSVAEKRLYVDTLLQKKEDRRIQELQASGKYVQPASPSRDPVGVTGGDATTSDLRGGDENEAEFSLHVEAGKSSQEQLGTAKLVRYVKGQLKEERLLKLLHGNARSMKRICNIILLALSVYREEKLSQRNAFHLLLVVVMVEQWPFRTSFLLQYFMNHVQNSLASKEVAATIGDLKVMKTEAGNTEEDISEQELIEAWKKKKGLVREVDEWKKFLSYDWDPELFNVFIDTYRLRFSHLKKYIRYAVNHDTNIESIVEQGLAELDDRKNNKQENEKQTE